MDFILSNFQSNSGMALQKLFDEALFAYQNGRLAEAENLCKRLLKTSPKSAPVLELGALVSLSQKKFDLAVELYSRLIKLNPKLPKAYLNRGFALKALGKIDLAIQNYDRAIALAPGDAQSHYNRANALVQAGKFDEAVKGYEKSIGLNPASAEAYANLGNVLLEKGETKDAISNFSRAIDIDQRHGQALYGRAKALHKINRYEEALKDFDRAIALNKTYFQAFNDKGLVLHDIERFAEALESYDKAISLNSNYVEAFHNRAITLTELNLFDEAMASYDKALALDPNYTPASWNRANLLLLLGRFEQGLQQFESRNSLKIFRELRSYKEPVWSEGIGLSGKVLLICHELYLGDMIQFCRYAKLAEARGAKVIISAQDCLRELLQGLGPAIEIIPENSRPDNFDCHISLMSLPLAFKTVLETIPQQVPYLHADKARMERWRKRLGDWGFKIGICWQGSKLSTDKKRSFPLSELHSISKLPNVRLISLQKSDGLEQLAQLPAGMMVETLGDDFDAGGQAFLDTAAVMKNLDLVITCDTAIAHLAGALAVPTWVVLKQVPDWRWLLARSDSPWYPTIRLFRQIERGVWETAFAQMESALISKLGSEI
jgi:tetratricopeptide (TPR) repeat protein